MHGNYSALYSLDPIAFDLLPVAICLCDAEGVLTRFNRAAAALCGLGTNDGCPAPNFRDLMTPPTHGPSAIDEVLRTGQPMRDHEVVIERNGHSASIAIDADPLFDAEGRIEGLVASLRDISARKLTAMETRTGADFLQAIIEATPECIKVVAADGTLVQMNPAGLRMIEAANPEAALGACTFDLVAPEDREQWRDYHERVCRGENLSWEFDLIGLNGTRRRMETHAVPLRHADGRVEQLAVTRDITRRTQNEGALRESERRLRQLLEALPTAIYTTDPEGRISFFNQAAVDMWGVRPEIGESLWCGSWRLFHTDGTPLPHDQCPMAVALKEDRPVRGVEAILERPDGTRIPFQPYPTPLHDEAGRLTGAVNMLIDISAHKQAEAQQQLLINELNHRVKNSLATVQSIVSQTLRGSGDMEAARKAVESRLLALARTHDTLTERHWEGADLRDIVTSALTTHCLEMGRCIIEGPPIRLTPKASLAIAMVLHELCTNAVKYGALSNEEGRVSVCWSHPDDDDERLSLVWRESGGPTVTPPSRRGFGSRLIERGAGGELDGRAQMEFDPAGLVCTLNLGLRGAHD